MEQVSWADIVKTKSSWADIVEEQSKLYETINNSSSQRKEPLNINYAVEEQIDKEIQQETPIGIRCVQSILMSATQKSLSHFHTAGMISAGNAISPSAADAMNSKYTSTNTSMKFKTFQQLAVTSKAVFTSGEVHTATPSKEVFAPNNIEQIRGTIVGATLKNFIVFFKSTVMGYLPERESIWYKVKQPSRDEMRLLKENKIHLLRFYIDYNKIKQYGLTLENIASKFFEQDYSRDCTLYTSPDFMGMMDVWFTEPTWLPSFLSKMSKVICGTPDILSCDVLSDNTTIVTTGSNIMVLSRVPSIDKKTITSNNVRNVEQCFGIEAAASILSDITGSTIVSDFMTRTGKVLPFYKNTKETYRKGLLTSMGFERPKEDIKLTLTKPNISTCSSVRTVYESVMTGMDPEYDFELYQASSQNNALTK